MHRLPSARLFFFCAVLIVPTAWGQQGDEATALTQLRSQAAAQAEEFVKVLNVVRGARVGIAVEGTENKEFTTNVFLEVLQKSGFVVSLAGQNVDATLEVFVLTQAVSYDGPENGKWKRTIRTALEARLRHTAAEQVQYLGNFDYSKVDTVSQKEDGWWVTNEGALLAGSSPGVFERIMTPLTVIAATVVVVYLFFTVRN